jgi:hypothetical protein
MDREEWSANHLILDYVAMCEKFGPLDFETFVQAWLDAEAIARMAFATSESDSEGG